MFIRTERLFLRPGWAEDAPGLTRAIAHEPVARMLARVPWPYTEEHARAWLESPRHPFLPSLLMTLPEERGRIVGGCGLHEGEGDAPQVGFWITPDCWGRGYAREALAGLIESARALGHQRLTARHAVDNPTSGKVLRSVGFRATGCTGPRATQSRPAEVECAEYVLELAPAMAAQPDWTNADAYAEGLDAAA